MVRANSAALRMLSLRYGADVVYSEELIAKRLQNTVRRENLALGTVDFVHEDMNGETIALRTDSALEKRRLVVQIGSGDPESAAKACAKVAHDCIGVDLNMGCPKKFSLTDGMGAALLRDPQRACEILRAMKESLSAHDCAVTCKIRLLPEDDDLSQTADLCLQLQRAGAQAIAVHCRYPGELPEKTKPQRERTRRLFEKLRSEHAAFRDDCALLLNGDFYDHTDIESACSGPGAADGVLLARPALLNPSIFNKKKKILLPRLEMLHDYMATAHKYGAHYKNAKYVVMEMLTKRRHPNEQWAKLQKIDPLPLNVTVSNVARTRSLEDIDTILGYHHHIDDHVITTTKTKLDALSADDRRYDDAYFLKTHDRPTNDEPRAKEPRLTT